MLILKSQQALIRFDKSAYNLLVIFPHLVQHHSIQHCQIQLVAFVPVRPKAIISKSISGPYQTRQV